MPTNRKSTRRAQAGTHARAAQTETKTPTAAAPGLLSKDRQLGNWLVYLRRNHPIPNQGDFAKRLGVKRSYMAAVEAGRTPLKLKVAWDACRVLGIHPDYLMDCGKTETSPFPVLTEADEAKAKEILALAYQANFIDGWAGMRSMLFPGDGHDLLAAKQKRLKADGEASARRVARLYLDLEHGEWYLARVIEALAMRYPNNS